MAIYLVLMVALILADVSLSVIIALSGLLPLLSGAISGVVVRRRGARDPAAGTAATRGTRPRSSRPPAGCS